MTKIRPILLRSVSENYVPIRTVGIRKVYQWKTFELVYPIYIASWSANVVMSLSRDQAVFVMHRFDDISRTNVKLPHQHTGKMPFNRVIIQIQAVTVKLTLGAVLKWTLSKLLASNW